MNDRFLAKFPIQRFEQPILGIVEVKAGYAPCVRYAGTLWRFKCEELDTPDVADQQLVKIIGRQGNSLIVELEAIDAQA